MAGPSEAKSKIAEGRVSDSAARDVGSVVDFEPIRNLRAVPKSVATETKENQKVFCE